MHLLVFLPVNMACTRRERFGWEQAKVDDLLLPVIRSYLDRSTQTRIDQFLTHSQRFAKIRSKRMQQAVARITGVEVNPDLYYAETRHLPELPKHTIAEDDGSAEEGVGDAAGDGAQEAVAAAILISGKGKRGAAAAGGRARGAIAKGAAASRGRRGKAAASAAAMRGAGRGRGRGRGRATTEEEQEDEDVGTAQADLAFARLVMQDGMR
jgi:DNA excision repair protein ERCC-5